MKYILPILLFVLASCGANPVPDTPENPTDEVKTFTTGLIKDPTAHYGQLHFSPKQTKALPSMWDWREHGGETPIRNQGTCGCCWIFGTTQSHEMGVKIFQGKDIDFSEQQYCGTMFSKCGGGDFADEALVKKGQTDEASCKYTATSKACTGTLPVAGKPVASGYVGAPNRRPTVDELKQSITSYGAVAVYVCGGNSAFMNAGTGLVTGPNCGTDHIVALIGWKDVDGVTYWLTKNSWGTAWANKGYGWIKHGSFNIAERAKWIAVEKVPCAPPSIFLVKEYVIAYGQTVPLFAKPIDGVTYSWWESDKKLGDGNLIYFTPSESTEITLKVENSCGKGEVRTKITVN